MKKASGPSCTAGGRSWTRKQLSVPRFDFLPESLRAEVEVNSNDLAQRVPCTPTGIARAPQRLFAPFLDPLSPAIKPNSWPRTGTRSETEAAVLDGLHTHDPQFPRATADLIGALARMNGIFTGSAEDPWRHGPIALLPDRAGNRVQFPSHMVVPAQLARLSSAFRQPHGPAIFIAAQALIIVTNAHPFREGNGRVGRVMANAALSIGGYRGYLPLFEIGLRTRGALVLAQRRAEQLDDWAPICRFLIRALLLADTLGRMPGCRAAPQMPEVAA